MTKTAKLAACTSAALLLATAACTSSDHSSSTSIPPSSGKAVILKIDAEQFHDSIVPSRPSDQNDRYAVEPIVLSPTLIYSNGIYGIDVVNPADSANTGMLNLGPGSTSRQLLGMVGLPGGDVAYVDDNQYQLRQCHPCTPKSAYHEEVLAGTATTTPRPTYDHTIPASIQADSITFTARAAPIGVRSDGSIIIVDGMAVWALKDGRLTRIYQRLVDHPGPPSADPGLDTMPVGRIGAVDPHDTVWLAPETAADQAKLGDVIGLGAGGGAAQPLRLPGRIAGIQAAPADLLVFAMVSDGRDGLYVEASSPSSADRYLIHVAGGTASLLAKSSISQDAELNGHKRTQGTYDSLKIPVVLPAGIAVLPNMILLTGVANYAVAVSIPR